jgi:hypothetical protein
MMVAALEVEVGSKLAAVAALELVMALDLAADNAGVVEGLLCCRRLAIARHHRSR